MEAWIKVYHDLSDHPKVYDLADRLKIEQYAAVGLVVCLWIWAIIHAPDGDLSRFPDAAIARACHWHKPAAALVKALTECGFLDDRHIHDWDEYAGALIEAARSSREKTRKRVEAYRARKAVTEALPDEPCNADVTRYTSVTDQESNALRNADVRECNAPRTRTRTITREIHTQDTQQEGYACAREGWYSPDDPDSSDEAWRDSPAVRGAIAQRILTFARKQRGFSDGHVVTEAGIVGTELHRALTAAMEAGVSPAECQDIGIRSGKAWIWEGRLKALAIEGGAQVPEDWKDQIREIREDIEEYEQEEA